MSKKEEIIKAQVRNSDLSNSEIAYMTGSSTRYVRKVLRARGFLPIYGVEPLDKPSDDSIHTTYDKESGVITTKSLNIKTVEEALDAAQVNLKKWEPYRHTINSWEVTMGNNKTVSGIPETYTNWQVKVWLQKRKVDFELFEKEILELISDHAPIYTYKDTNKVFEKIMLELDFMDLHYGKHAWGKETGVDYDAKIAERDLFKALDDLLNKTSWIDPEIILLPIGNDLLHIDSLDNLTTRGTRQDVDDRQTKLFSQILYVIVKIVDKIATKTNKVYMPIIPGNHDQMSLFHLGVALEAWYRNNDRVVVDNSPKLRKYVEYGVNLIGFSHGGRSDANSKDLPLIMAQEAKEAWGRTLHREWHTGHFHKKKQNNYSAGDTYNGVIVRVISSLCGTDAWHYQHGFIGNRRSAEAFIYDIKEGCIGNITTYV